MKRFAALLLLATALASPLGAQDSLETAKRHELEDLNRQAREKRAAANQLKGQESQALVQLRRTERQLTGTRRRLRALEQRRTNLDQQLEVTHADLERSLEALARQKAKLARRLRALYKYGAARELEFLLSTRSFGQLLARWDFLVMVAEQDRMLLEDIAQRKAQVEVTQQRIEGTLTEVQKTAKKTQRETQHLATLRQSHEQSVKSIHDQRSEYEAAAAEFERNARALSRLLADLERRRRAEADRARSEGRNPQPYTGDFARGQGVLDWPVRGDVVGHFGPEVHPKWGTTTINNGIDIEAPMGAPVHAVAKGRVEYTSDDYAGYGEIVILNHGDGYYTLYAHLSDISVAQGVEVVSGQTIGKVGDTGSLKGTVLHFEVRKGGSALNPADWLK
ncbi:MAG: peptidoglycan DD-metalloendopeptidase family protein [Candidatus Eisenbacteria bacterium]|nr:peptidoglycan DD-metalloendopeptidase family protein [Candidatus Eisenbacteria bacterium]